MKNLIRIKPQLLIMSIDIPHNVKLKLKHGRLHNNINYVVSMDSDAIVANVGIGIKVGSIHDPLEYMGMAHFLEHMLFLGSKKYKDENYFDTMVKQYGGSSNAYTSLFETVYYFNVIAEHLNKMLDIFSRFFIDPLFDINSISREINAINSEHMKNYNNEFWIISQLIRDISDNDNCIHRFTTGTHETFGNDYDKLREAMINFYNKYYCSENLYIVVQSNIDVDDMEKLIIKYFNMIEKKSCPLMELSLYPKFSVKNKEYQIQPSQDNEYIVYFWDLFSACHYHDNHITNMIDHIITMRCENNLYDILNQTLCVASIETYYMEEGIFTVRVTMIKNMKTVENIIKINNIVANYFNNLQKLNWDELYNGVNIMYNFIYNNSRKQHNDDIMMDMVTNMMYYKVKNIYNGNKLIYKKDHVMLQKTLSLLEFKNASVIYGTTIELDGGDFLIEPYYNKQYKPLKYGYIRNITKKNYNFHVNIDTDIYNIKPHNIDINIPIPIQINKNTWYGGVSHFNEPFARVDILMRNDNMFNTIISSIVSNIAINIINYYFSIYFCQYLNVDYNVAIVKQNDVGLISLILTGYNDKFMDFVSMVLNKIKIIKVDDNIIKLYYDKYKQLLLANKTQTSWSYADMITDRIYKYYYEYTNQLNVLPSIDIKMIKKRIKTITQIKCFNVTSVWYGNIHVSSQDNIISYLNKIHSDIIHTKIVPYRIQNIRVKHPNKHEQNKCIMICLPCTNYSKYVFVPRDIVTIIILAAILKQPVYGELRTKHQLGYMVGSHVFNDNINMYIIIKVQSDKSVKLVEHTICQFMNEFRQKLIDYDNKKFNQIKKSVHDKLMEPPMNMSELNSIMLAEIKKEQYIFNSREQLAKEIENIELNDIIKLYHSIIKKYKKIIVS